MRHNNDKKIVYIVGPITSSDKPDMNRGAFEKAESMLELRYNVINPWRNYGGGRDNATHAMQTTYMRLSFHQLLCVDAIYILAGWKRSPNCEAEVVVAKCLALEVVYAAAAEK